MAGDETQSFSFDTVAVLVAMLMKQGGSLGMSQYERMSALDGKRTPSSFDHQFRKVKNRAKEINAKYEEGGETAVPSTPARGRSKPSTPATGGEKSGAKRTRKSSAKATKANEEEDGESPSKKVKAEPNEDGEIFGGKDKCEESD